MKHWGTVGLAIIWLTSQAAFAALTPSIQSEQIRDFTRLTFNWPEQVRFRVDPFQRGVRLTFSKPTDISSSSLSGPLSGLVRQINRSADGTIITINFNDNYGVRHFVSGNANGIDILGASKSATPRPTLETTESTPTAAELRDNTPLPTPTAKPSREPERAEPAQEEPSTTEPSEITSDGEPLQAPAQAPTEQAVAEDDVTSAEESIATEQTTPPTPEETIVAQASAAETADTPAPAPAPEAIAETSPQAEPDPFAQFAPPEPEAMEVNEIDETEAEKALVEVTNETTQDDTPQTTDVVTDNAAPFASDASKPEAGDTNESTDTADSMPAIAEEIQAPSPTNAEPTQNIEEPQPEPTQRQAEQIIAASRSAASEASDTSIMPLQPSQSIPADADNLEPEPAPAALTEPPVMEQVQTNDGGDPFLITTYSLATGTEIRFPWRERVAASVFMRDDILWIIFSGEKRLNMPMLQSILPAAITNIEQIPLAGHTALRLQTDGTVYPKVTQPKNTSQWWVTLSVYRQIPASPIAIERKIEGTQKPHLYVPTLQYSKPTILTDPMIGDDIMIVPYFNVGEGVYPAREFPELDLLASAQGMAAVKKDDFAEIIQLRNGFRLTARDGLSLSSDLPELALAELESFGESVTWYPYENWRVEQGQFFDVRRELERQLHDASDVRANSLRLKLAQLYLGEGMANESLAWLSIIEQRDPFFFKDRKLIALRGAAHFLNDDYALAKRAFSDEALKDYDEHKLWLAALRVFEQQRPRFDYMDYFPTYISKYPPLMREKLGIIATDNYINRRSFSRALRTLDTLSLTGIRDETTPYVNFLLGKIAAENGNMDGAKELWEPLIEADSNRFVRATAEFALTTMLYNKGEIDRTEATQRLDRLRVVWRGDGLELALLSYLGQLYADDRNYIEALRAWQDLVQNFPESEIAIDTARKMAETFNFLYAENGADEMSPLKALATFYEFRELTPIGEAGDNMIQQLAHRLAGVDLLDRAAALLEHQIKFRQEKLARSKLGAKLALYYLLDDKPELALKKLELTGYGQMPRELALERTRIAAMAMSELDETQRAINMLSNDASREADELRLQLFWEMRDWPGAISMGERLLGSRSDVSAPLSKSETEQLMQLSIAYMFERNRTQLDYLRNYYEPLLPEGPNRDIFLFVTNPGAPLDPQRFDEVSGQIARMEGFMENYRDQIREGGLSPVLN